jgi:hypothetical protein
MALHSKYIKGNLAYYDTHLKRIIDAIGPDVVKYVDDFVYLPVDDTTGDPTAFTTTVVEAGASNTTVTSGNESGGVLLITTDANENDGANLQLNGESFELTADQHLYFGARVKVSEATQSDLFIGLAITDTDILGGVTDRIGFQSVDGEDALDFVLEKDSTETKIDDVGTLVADTYYFLEFYFDGTGIEVFVDGVSMSTPVVTNLPNDEQMRVSVQFLAGSTTAKTCSIDFIRCIQFGR